MLSLSLIGKETVESVIDLITNPFVSLFVGLLITALIQSSSATTAMIVAMVASGSLEMHRAIPIIMGANIGTTLTSNIVSLNFITKKEDFRRAFSVATLHDQFNILVTVILFPLQYKYNLLGILAAKISNILSFDTSNLKGAPNTNPIFNDFFIGNFVLDLIGNPYLGLALALVLLFASIKLLTKIIYKIFIGDLMLKLEHLLFKNYWKSFGWGVGLTAAIQSSSMTTSVVVPLVATGKVKFRSVYPFIIGANIGTTITALLASIFKSPEAISIALIHLMFNVIGGIIFLLIPGIKNLPIIISDKLGELTIKYRVISVLYIIITFFLLPFVLIYMTK